MTDKPAPAPDHHTVKPTQGCCTLLFDHLPEQCLTEDDIIQPGHTRPATKEKAMSEQPQCDQCKTRDAIWMCLLCCEFACVDCRGIHEDSHRETPEQALSKAADWAERFFEVVPDYKEAPSLPHPANCDCADCGYGL